MSDALNLQPLEVPGRIAELGFVVELPQDWIHHPLQEASLEFQPPAFLGPLAVVTAPHAVIVFSVAARPAYEEGTLSDWARYLLGEHGIKPQTFSDAWLGELPAILGEAEQPSDYGPMRVRFAFAEDGGRLINVSLTAPTLLGQAMEPVWRSILSTFQLGTPHGPTVPVWPAGSTDDSAVVQYDEYVEPPEPEKGPMPGSDANPPWWKAAQALEAAGHLDEAELAIRSAVQHQGALIQIAELYRLRLIRLRDAGDVAGAHLARAKAVDWAKAYAASATSGGEGTALSLERDDFIASLGPE